MTVKLSPELAFNALNVQKTDNKCVYRSQIMVNQLWLQVGKMIVRRLTVLSFVLLNAFKQSDYAPSTIRHR